MAGRCRHLADGAARGRGVVFDLHLAQVLLVNHRWRGWVPPGGRVEPGETPREAARRELLEETGLRLDLLAARAAVTVRCYRPGWPATLGLSYTAVIDAASPLQAEQASRRPGNGWIGSGTAASLKTDPECDGTQSG